MKRIFFSIASGICLIVCVPLLLCIPQVSASYTIPTYIELNFDDIDYNRAQYIKFTIESDGIGYDYKIVLYMRSNDGDEFTITYKISELAETGKLNDENSDTLTIYLHADEYEGKKVTFDSYDYDPNLSFTGYVALWREKGGEQDYSGGQAELEKILIYGYGFKLYYIAIDGDGDFSDPSWKIDVAEEGWDNVKEFKDDGHTYTTATSIDFKGGYIHITENPAANDPLANYSWAYPSSIYGYSPFSYGYGQPGYGFTYPGYGFGYNMLGYGYSQLGYGYPGGYPGAGFVQPGYGYGYGFGYPEYGYPGGYPGTGFSQWYNLGGYTMATPWQSSSPYSLLNTYSFYTPQQFLYNQPYTSGLFFQSPYNIANYSLFSPFYNPLSPTTGITTLQEGYYAKPAIYLYPEKDSYITVKLDIDGKITTTIPAYNDGWRVFATKEGIITNEEDRQKYDYLFWEADPNIVVLPDTGWVVAQVDLEKWFDEYLDKLGLNKKEKTQFMEYWMERLSESAYYELKLLSSEFLAEHTKLIITPQPDILIRVIFHFRPLDKPMDKSKSLTAPVIETPQREGFVVVEWGGILSQPI